MLPRTNFFDRFILPNTSEIAYQYVHHHQSETILFLHPLAMDGLFWKSVVDQLGSSANILLIDCPGHGASSTPEGPYDPAAIAKNITVLEAHLNLNKVIVVGASMGGCIAIERAKIDAPEVAGAVLIDTTAWYGVDAVSAWAERSDKANCDGLESLSAFQVSRWFSDSFAKKYPDIVNELLQVFTSTNLAGYVQSCSMLGNYDGRSGLEKIKCPCQLLVGEFDYAAPVSMSQALHKSIPHSHLNILPGLKHHTAIEDPNTISQLIAELLTAT